MKIAAAIVSILITTTLANAEPMQPVEMLHTASGAPVLVACYDVPAQMKNADAGDRKLLVIIRKSAWAQDRVTIRRAMTRLIERSDRLTPARMQAIKDSLSGAGARIQRTSDPRATLTSLGIAPIGD